MLFINRFIILLDASVMDAKHMKQKLEIVALSKRADQYKRMATNMRSTILKLTENFNKNKGKSRQLLNENEWMQSSYLAELKVSVVIQSIQFYLI